GAFEHEAQGETAADLLHDLRVATSAIPVTAESQLIAGVNPALAQTLGLLPDSAGAKAFVDLAVDGGDLAGIRFVPTAAISADSAGSEIVIVDASAIAVSDGELLLRQAEHASLQMDDVPTNPPTSSTVLRSLWQRNEVAVCVERIFGLKKLHPD